MWQEDLLKAVISKNEDLVEKILKRNKVKRAIKQVKQCHPSQGTKKSQI